jgi:hypothetical protein
MRRLFIRLPDDGQGWRKLENQLFFLRCEAEVLDDMRVEDSEGDGGLSAAYGH